MTNSQQNEQIDEYYDTQRESVDVVSRYAPLCNVPPLVFGNTPNDGGNLILGAEEYDEIAKKDRKGRHFIRPVISSEDLVHTTERWCIWLQDVELAEIIQCPEILKRLEKVQNYRLHNKRESIQKLAEKPMLFGKITHTDAYYLIIPKISPKKNDHMFVGFISPMYIATDDVFILPNATLYDFGILTSKIHMAWVKAVSGQLKNGYRYSIDIVYNNFPFPEPTERQKEEIEKCAEEVLDIRNKCFVNPADLYNSDEVSEDLCAAYERLDKAVGMAYGQKFENEEEIVGYLMERYKELVKKEN